MNFLYILAINPSLAKIFSHSVGCLHFVDGFVILVFKMRKLRCMEEKELPQDDMG